MWSVYSHCKQYLTCLEYSDNSNRKNKSSTSTQRVSIVLRKDSGSFRGFIKQQHFDTADIKRYTVSTFFLYIPTFDNVIILPSVFSNNICCRDINKVLIPQNTQLHNVIKGTGKTPAVF